MQTKRKILGIVASTVVSTLLVAVAVFATTTISTNIVTDGNLTVTGTAGITGATTLTGALTANGNVTLGSDAADTTIVNSRIATEALGGTEVSIGADYAYNEALEMRYGVDSWAGFTGSFKGYYFRTTANVGSAADGLQGMQVYGVSNITGTTGLANLQTLYAEMLIKDTTAATTITDASAVEANVSIDSQTGTLTFTNEVYALKAKVQTGNTGGIADATKLNGIAVQGRGNVTRTFGDAIAIVDPEAAAATWTNGISISAGTATGISITGATSSADIRFYDSSTIDTGVVDDTTLRSIVITPKASATTSGINYHHLVAIDGTFGDPAKRTYGLVAGFSRNDATTAAVATDTGLDVRVQNNAINFAGYKMQGAYIKAKNDHDPIHSVLDTMKGLFVEAYNEEFATVGTLIGIEIGVNADGTETTATGLKFSNDGTPPTSAFTDISLQNGETITNTTNGIVAVGGDFAVNGVRINDGAGATGGDIVEAFLKISGDLTGVGSATTKATTYPLQIDVSRPLGTNVINSGATSEAAIKVNITNYAAANDSTYILRGMDVNAKNRNTGNVQQIQGAYITAENRDNCTGAVTDMMGVYANVKNGGSALTGNVIGLKIEDQSPSTLGTHYGLWIDESAEATSVTKDYAIAIKTTGTGTWTNGLNFGGTITNAFDFAAATGTNGAKTSAGADQYVLSHLTADGVIRVDINGTPYWIPVFDAASVTNE